MQTQKRLHILQGTIKKINSPENKITMSVNNGFEFEVLKNMVRIESSTSYFRIFILSGEPTLVTRILKDFEEPLTPYHFFSLV